MGYSKDLEEYTDAELREELTRRLDCAQNNICSYCGRPCSSSPCRFPGRHKETKTTDSPETEPGPKTKKPPHLGEIPFTPVLGVVRVVTEAFDDEATGLSARATRLRLGIKLRELAEAMGCSTTYVSAIERGQKQWTWHLVGRYSDAILAITKARN